MTGLQANGNAFYLDLNNSAYTTTLQSTDEFGFTINTAQSAAYGAKVNSSFLAGLAFNGTSTVNGATVNNLLELSAGATIGGNLTYTGNANNIFAVQPAAGAISGNWKVGDTGYVGLEIGGTNNYEYGWAQFTLNNLAGSGVGAFTLRGFALQTDGTALAAGQVPEPSTVALLVAGAAGVGVMRSRLRRQTAPPVA